MWLIWSLFWTLMVICLVASQDNGPTASLLPLALGCAAAAGVGWATAACAPGESERKESIALMIGWASVYAAATLAMDAAAALSRAGPAWHGEPLIPWLASALGGALLGTLSAVVLIRGRLPAAQRIKKGLRIVTGWMIAFLLAAHMSWNVAYISGALLEVGERFLLVLGALISGLITGYICSGVLASALKPDA